MLTRDNFVIYKITNLISKKLYIGSAVYFAQRRGEHLSKLRRQIHPNKHLQNSFNKYREENFKFEIVEHSDKEHLIEREQFWIDILNPEYNHLRIARSSMGFKHSEETKKRLSEGMKGHKRCVGRKLSKETRKGMGLSRRKVIYQYSLSGTFIREWESAHECARVLKLTGRQGITDCAKGRLQTSSGFTWSYNLPKTLTLLQK